MLVIKGDLIKLARQGMFDVIVHGCNCMCKMEAGIAKQIKRNFPEAYEADKKTKIGDIDKLGTCSFAHCRTMSGLIIVVNAYTQFDYRGRGIKVDYAAIDKCVRWLTNKYSGMKIGMPKIGAGLGGGEWKIIKGIVEKASKNANVTIVELNN